MIKRKVFLKDILDFLGGVVIRVHGSTEGLFIDNLADVGRVCETSLDWVKPSNPKKNQIVAQSRAHVLLVDPEVMPIEDKTLIVVNNPKVALARVGNRFFADEWQPLVHKTSIIHPEAQIGKDCYIGPYTVVGKATIGEHTYIDSFVRVYDGVMIGHDCVIKSGSVLGGAGFGYERDEDGNKFRFPQIGQLVIGDYVEVGANTCIDRGALADTVIGDYTKINNLCHIAHNNRIGRNVTITGCVNLSGSNIIDDNVWIAPNSSIRGWVHVGEGAIVGMGAVVVKDIPPHETWIGNPAHKMEKKR